MAGQLDKINVGLAHIEKSFDASDDRVDIGRVSLGCALGYLDFRFGDLGWRSKCPKLGAWYDKFSKLPAMEATKP